MADYTPIIGMEVHVELNTDSKMFCRCSASHFQVTPNTHTCPVCLGLPGALPVPNERAIEDTIKIGLSLNCSVNENSKFDRKHYFYPDLPKGYQISQYDQPLCEKGFVILGSGKKIRVTRVHLEEDTGKLKHEKVDGKEVTLVDYNRSGVPLVEIVSEPDISSADEAKEYLKLLHSTVRFLGVSDADMEKGSMRLEANISVSLDGVMPSYKVEVKNVNSFRYIAAAIDYEIARHTEILKSGETPKQETRGWNLDGRKTVSQRSKEEAKDYRYFPEPDIPPLIIDVSRIDEIKKNMPLLPSQVINELIAGGVRRDYAVTVSEDVEFSRYVLEMTNIAKDKKVDADKVVGLVINNKVDWKKKTTMEVVGEFIRSLSKEILSDEETGRLVEEVITENENVVLDYKKGKLNALQFLLGQVMAKSRGKADPGITRGILESKLSS